jgi:hypothetical protein
MPFTVSQENKSKFKMQSTVSAQYLFSHYCKVENSWGREVNLILS